jgi:hypothetical protein
MLSRYMLKSRHSGGRPTTEGHVRYYVVVHVSRLTVISLVVLQNKHVVRIIFPFEQFCNYSS